MSRGIVKLLIKFVTCCLYSLKFLYIKEGEKKKRIKINKLKTIKLIMFKYYFFSLSFK